MNVKRYFAKTAREALRALKAELGADAIVLSNRAVDDGVEILALPAEAVGALESSARAAQRTVAASSPPPAFTPVADMIRKPVAPARSLYQPPEDDDYTVSLSSSVRGRNAAASAPAGMPGAKPAAQTYSAFDSPRVDAADDYPARKRNRYEDEALSGAAFDMMGNASTVAAPPCAVERARPVVDTVPDRIDLRAPSSPGREAASPRLDADDDRIRSLEQANAQLMTELSGIRGMIERQLAGFAWGETRRNAPARAQILGELLEAGFSGQLARQLAELVDEQASVDQAHDTIRKALGRDLRAMSSDADLIDQGGVYALVGPTGVGKTTTTAKIAARCVVRHGAEKLALITTDGYRIGAQEQLRIYGRILGVPVFPVRDAADLRQTLGELRNKHMVLIDTVGMSQRDRMVAHQAAMLMGAGNVRRLLLLNATARGDTLDDVIRAYRGPDLAGCIFTKVDEAASLAPAIGAAIANELEVFYVTNGQRVPEDLHLPNRAYLLHRALREKAQDSPWRLQSDEAVLMMASGGGER